MYNISFDELKKKLNHGRIANFTNTALWIAGDGMVHRLDPKRVTPRKFDADGVRSVNGEVIFYGVWPHWSWWKIHGLDSAWVGRNILGGLFINFGIPVLSRPVGDDEFGPLKYDNSAGWGEPIEWFYPF